MRDKSAAGRRSVSTAQNINLRWVGKLFFIFLLMDALILATLVVFGLLNAEGQDGTFFLVETGRVFIEGTGYSLAERLQSSSYLFTEPGAEAVAVFCGPFLLLCARVIFVALWAEGFLLVWQFVFGARGVRRRLRPLTDLARDTQRLGSDAKLQSLAGAISRMDPIEDARLSTGDRDLAGLEDAVNDLLRRQQEAYLQQSRFVSDASHELRTPIAVVEGYANMLDRWGKQDEKVLDEGIAAIKAESARMRRLVEQLLFLARGDSGRQPMEKQPVLLNDVLAKTRDEAAMIDADHVYTFTAGTLPPVVGDAGLLQQAARVLTDNAAKFTPAGGAIALSTGVTPEGNPYFQVQDEGTGIDGEDLPHIFERFYRADPARAKGGSGLGLSIARWIADNHGAYFDVVSRKGLGTRMRMVFGPRPRSGEQ